MSKETIGTPVHVKHKVVFFLNQAEIFLPISKQTYTFNN